MATPTGKETIEFKDLSKGLNTYDPETAIPEGYYVDAQNMLLTDKSPVTIGGLTKLNATAAPDTRGIVWFEPFATPDTGSHSDIAHSDVAHADVAHSDTAHSDVAHGDGHSDVAHSDVAHSDTHSDVAHSDSHSDGAHADSNGKGHADTPHSDSHGDTAHSDTHSDVAHSDAHSDGHSDSAHSDVAFVDVAHSDGAHSDIAHTDSVASASFVVALDRGADTDGDGSGIWSYNPNTDTWSHLWTLAHDLDAEVRYRVSPPYYSSVPFRSRLFFANSGILDDLGSLPAATTTLLVREDSGHTADNPLKHDGRYLMPLGGAGYSFDVPSIAAIGSDTVSNQRVATMETQAPFSEVWTGGTDVTTAGNYKDFLHARSLSGIANMFLDYDATDTTNTARDFLTGLLGAPNFGASDFFTIWFKPTTTAAGETFTFRFGDNAGANFFAHTTAALTLTANEWYEYSVRRSAFAVGAGAPVWSSIQRFTIFSNTAATVTIFDAAYWQYERKPTSRAAVVEMYNNQLMLGDIYDAKTTVKFSNVGTPDYFDPAIGVARFDGGRLTLGEQDRITSLWAYFDELIVGKTSSSWTFSGTGANVSIAALPLTIGVLGHRAIVETPWSLHYLYDNNIFGARLTSRGMVSTNINSYIENLNVIEGYRVMSTRSDFSHTVRWSFRTNTADLNRNDLGMLYDYQLDAWASKYTPRINHYTQWVNYTTRSRQVLTAMYDGYIRIADLGTSFDGTAIESWVTLPWRQNPNPQSHENVVQWMDATFYLRGTANVMAEARFADDPHEFDSATYSTYGTVLATPDGGKGYVQFARTARWMQLRLRATSLAFTVDLPIVIGFNSRPARV